MELRRHTLPAEDSELLRSVFFYGAGRADRPAKHIDIPKSVLPVSLRKGEGTDTCFDTIASVVKRIRLDAQLVVTGIDADGSYLVSYLTDVAALLDGQSGKSKLETFDYLPDSPIARAFLTELQPHDVFMLVSCSDSVDLWKFIPSTAQKKDLDRLKPITKASVATPVAPEGHGGEAGRANRPREESWPTLSDAEHAHRARMDWIWNDGQTAWALGFWDNGDLTLAFRHRELDSDGPAVPAEEFKDRLCTEAEHHSVPLNGEALRWIREKVADAIAVRQAKPGPWTMRELEEICNTLTCAIDEKRKGDRAFFGGRPWPERRAGQGAETEPRAEKARLIAEHSRRLTQKYGNVAMVAFVRRSRISVVGEDDDYTAASLQQAVETLLNDGWTQVGTLVFEDVGKTRHGETAAVHVEPDSGSGLDPAVQLAALQEASKELVKRLNADPSAPWFRTRAPVAGSQPEAATRTAQGMLKELLEGRGLMVESVESKGPREAAARVVHEGSLRTVTAEVTDEGSGLWAKDTDPCHPQSFAFPGGVPIPASKADAVGASFLHVIFSPDGCSAGVLLGEDIKKHGTLRPAEAGREALYVVPMSRCLVLHEGRPREKKEMGWRQERVFAVPAAGEGAAGLENERTAMAGWREPGKPQGNPAGENAQGAPDTKPEREEPNLGWKGIEDWPIGD